jgi:hypothetical protein
MKAEKLILTFDDSHTEELLNVLSSMRFVFIERKEDILDKFIGRAPKNVPLNDEDIMAEIKAYRKEHEDCY